MCRALARKGRSGKGRSRDGWRGSRRGRLRGRDAGEALQNGVERLGLDVADRDGLGEPAYTVKEMGDLVPADLALGVDEPGEVVAVEVDAALGEGKGAVHAEQSGEHAGRLATGVGFKVGERRAVQVLDPSGYPSGREVGQAAAFTVGGPGPPRHAGVPGLRTGAGSRWS